MLVTILQSFSFTPHIASEELIVYLVLQSFPFGCHGNQSKRLCIYNKKTMFGKGPLKEHFCKSSVKKFCNEVSVNANFYFFPIVSQWEL